MPKNLNHLIKSFKGVGLNVKIVDSWDDNYYLIIISNPNQDDDYYELYFDKQTGRYASYIDGRYFIKT